VIEIKDFLGKELMSSVRDSSISRFQNILNGKLKSKEAIELTSELEKLNESQRAFIEKIVIKTVDNVMFNFLNMLEENEDTISLVLTDEKGNKSNVVELSDGLSGELFTEDGWISKFSNYS